MPEDDKTKTPEPKTFSQEELNALLAKERREADERARQQYGATPEEIKALREAEEARKNAELTELQKAQAALEAEKTAKATLEAELSQAKIDGIRSRLIGAAETKLPTAYQSLIKGTTEDEIKVSLAEVVKTYQEDLKAAGVQTKQPMGASTNQGKIDNTKPLSAYTSRELSELYQKDPAAYNRLFGR